MSIKSTASNRPTKYTDCPLTNFPVNEDTWTRMMDVNSVLLPLTIQYNAYVASGNLTAANKIIQDNPDLLDCFFNADKWNKLRDAIISLERYFLEEVQDFIRNVAKNAIGINDSPTAEQSMVVTYSAKKINELLDEIRSTLQNNKDELQKQISSLSGTIGNTNNLVDKIHKKRSIPIPVSGWSNSYPFTNTVSVSGVTGADIIKIIGVHHAPNATAEQVKDTIKSVGYLIHSAGGVTDGRLTFKAYKRPTVDITIVTEGG